MHPRVQNRDRASDHLRVRTLFGAESVKHVVLFLATEDVEAALEVLGDEVGGAADHLLPLFVAFLDLLRQVILQCPQARVSEQRTQIDAESPHEVRMVEPKHLLDIVLEEDTEHPDLLVRDGTARSLVHAVFSESRHKGRLLVIDDGLVQVDQLGLVFAVDSGRDGLQGAKGLLTKGEVGLEVRVQLVKVSHAAGARLRKMPVSLHLVFLILVRAVENE